ncbi:hypothetical protein C1H70_04565 [Halomonas urumqiensis]|uniref:DUF427 domain-containing protein n=2 Tax=Halomonas urumqiensis TaxID=1684789 RepID=A0A2N7UN08_9GAMM|nr:hypothetical protein C1H70_04565 [Halomonas urumqiensis]PTB02446.1 DUF427 domain-containing protein [Halomonas urumqiensis]
MDSTEPRITLHPHEQRVQVMIDDTLLADTTRAIELREHGYPPCQYIPCDDAEMRVDPRFLRFLILHFVLFKVFA